MKIDERLPKQDPRYGEVIVRCGIADDDGRTFVVSVLEHRGGTWLDVRSTYEKGGEMHFGKGVRLPMGLAGELFQVVGNLADAWENL
jgi:hypothetical protein